jgi:hypothetical protein
LNQLTGEVKEIAINGLEDLGFGFIDGRKIIEFTAEVQRRRL